MPDEEHITVVQAARQYGVSERHLRRLARDGIIAANKLGRDWFVKPSAVMEYLRQERRPGPKPRGRRSTGD